MEDGVDYVPAKAPILMGHHFSSIAGAGPITGPISAAGLGFGWLACTLWILIGGIFFGGVHDFGALFASVRHGGKSIGEIISANMSLRAKRLFIIFSYLTLILVVAAFASIVAGTFGATYDGSGVLDKAASTANAQVAMVSLLFIVIAIIFGYFVYRRERVCGHRLRGRRVRDCRDHPHRPELPPHLPVHHRVDVDLQVRTFWSLPSLLSGSCCSRVTTSAPSCCMPCSLWQFSASSSAIPPWTACPSSRSLRRPLLPTNMTITPVFPVLFTTIACGAISGFHSLVASGTTSKQLDKETDAKPIAYGGMLIECVLAILTLVAVAYAYKWNAANPDAALKGATAIFGGGIAGMIDPSRGTVYHVLYTLLVLTYSTFCLTSLDTATRMGRFMFQEFWIDGSKGETPENVTGFKKVMANPYVRDRHHRRSGHPARPERLPEDLGAVRLRQPAAGRSGSAGCGYLARQCRQEQQDVPHPHGLHAGRHHLLPDHQHQDADRSDHQGRRRLGAPMFRRSSACCWSSWPSSSRSRVSPPSASRPRPRLRSKLGFPTESGRSFASLR